MSFLYNSAALEASAVASAVSARVNEIIATNTSAGVLYFQVFDSATVPANATVPEVSIAVPATSSISWDPEGDKVSFPNGIAVCFSSTSPVKTVAGSIGTFCVRGSVD